MFEFNAGLYRSRSVKIALQKAQHDKCAICESKVTHIAYGDVEHFRPKAAYRQSTDGPLVRPGYYWLAYDWSNLLFCCQLCNQRFKRNHFPLIDPSQRAKSHNDEIGNEQPLLINPTIRRSCRVPRDFERTLSTRSTTTFAAKNHRGLWPESKGARRSQTNMVFVVQKADSLRRRSAQYSRKDHNRDQSTSQSKRS